MEACGWRLVTGLCLRWGGAAAQVPGWECALCCRGCSASCACIYCCCSAGALVELAELAHCLAALAVLGMVQATHAVCCERTAYC